MLTINDIRSIYPEYNDLTDYELSTAFHRARYADMPYEQFAESFGGPQEEAPDVLSARAYNSRHPDSPIRPEDIGQGGFADDMGHSFAAGLNDLAALPFWGAEKSFELAGAEWIADKSKTAKEYFQRSAEEKRQGVSADMKLAREKEFITEDASGEHGLGDAWSDPRAVGGMIAESLPSMGVSMIGAAGVANTLVKMGMSRPLAWGIGSSVGEGAVAGAQNSMSAYDGVMQMPEEVLEQTPEYQELRQSMEPAQARKVLANGIAGSTAWQTALSTGLLSAPAGAMFGKILGGEIGKTMFRTIGKQAVAEGAEETLQSGAEHYLQQRQLQRADSSIDPTRGLANAAVAGGIAGAFMGGGMGGVGHMVGRNTRNASLSQEPHTPPAPLVPETDEHVESSEISAPLPSQGDMQRMRGLAWLVEQEEADQGRVQEMNALKLDIQMRAMEGMRGGQYTPSLEDRANAIINQHRGYTPASQQASPQQASPQKTPAQVDEFLSEAEMQEAQDWLVSFNEERIDEEFMNFTDGRTVDLLNWKPAEAEKPSVQQEVLSGVQGVLDQPQQLDQPMPPSGGASIHQQPLAGVNPGLWSGGRSQLAYGPKAPPAMPVQSPVQAAGPSQPVAPIPAAQQILNTQQAPRADTTAQAQALGMPAPDPMPAASALGAGAPAPAMPSTVTMPSAPAMPPVLPNVPVAQPVPSAPSAPTMPTKAVPSTPAVPVDTPQATPLEHQSMNQMLERLPKEMRLPAKKKGKAHVRALVKQYEAAPKERLAGTNSRGQRVFVDDKGVRSVEEMPGVRLTQDVQLVPTHEGMKTSAKSPEELFSTGEIRFLTQDELAAFKGRSTPFGQDAANGQNTPNATPDHEQKKPRLISRSLVSGEETIIDPEETAKKRAALDRAKAEEAQAVTSESGKSDEDSKPIDLSEHFASKLQEGAKYANIGQARRESMELTGKRLVSGTNDVKSLDEAVELGVVKAARAIISDMRENGASDVEIYRRLVELYQQQPNLAVRTSTSVAQQAYSTPVPLAFLASHLAGITEATTVYEPTAGNGMLILEANLHEPRRML